MSNESDSDAFAKLFAQHDRWLHAYLLALLTDYSSAEEVFQEVCVVLWRKYEQFDPETNFRRWAAAVARNKVHQYWDKQTRQARCLSNEVLELVAEEAIEQADFLEERRKALHVCLGKLPKPDRELVSACYSDANRSFQKVAVQLGRPINTVYKALQRIRNSLRECIERNLAANR
jgi:RNA polymerase sigma-70 factor (ECF subfamily)